MFDQVLRSLQDTFAIKGIRRALWTFLMLMVLFVGFEAQTNYFELGAVSKRLELVEKASAQPLTPDQTSRIEKLKSAVLADLEFIQIKRSNPFQQFLKMAVRFVKGAWVTVPIFWLAIKIVWYFVKNVKREDTMVRAMMLQFGLFGLAAVAWVTTILGINSVLWNGSENVFISWLVFPICSGLVLIVVMIWTWLLRTFLPKEKPKVVPSSDANAPEQA